MADDLDRFVGPVGIASGADTLFTGVVGHKYTIKTVLIENNTDTDVDVKLGIDGLTDDDLFLRQSTVDAHGEASFGGIVILKDDETIQSDATDAGLTITVSGLDQTP